MWIPSIVPLLDQGAVFSIHTVACAKPATLTHDDDIRQSVNDQVANTGNVDLIEVAVDDPEVPNDCMVAELGVAVTMSCIGTYSLTWADIRAGTKSNTAT